MSEASEDRSGGLRALVLSPRTWLVAAALVILVGVSRQLLVTETPPPPSYFTLPPFTLTSHEGRPFGTSDLQGRAWVAGFFFTRCPTICPVLLQRQQEIQRRAAALGDRFQLVTITIDPGHDTPQVLREHAERMGIRLDRWTWLTGATDEVQQVVRAGFKEHVEAAAGMAPADVVHSVRFFLVDGQRNVRGLYDGMDENQVRRLVADARAVLAEPAAADGR